MVFGVFIWLRLTHRLHHSLWPVPDTWKGEIAAFERGIMLEWVDQVGLEAQG